MPIVQFTGHVLPKIYQISLQSPSIIWKSSENELEVIFNIQINNSLVHVNCDINQFLSTNFNLLLGVTQDFVRACVDMISFTMAKSFNVIIDTFIDSNGQSSLIVMEDPYLADLCTAYSLEDSEQNNLNLISQIVMTEPPLFIALNELIMSISDRHGAPARCARVVEGIKKMISPVESNSRKAWSNLHKTLCIEENYLKYITEHSKAPRHGDRAYIPGSITRDVTRRAWVVMNRFLEFRKRGSVPLPQSEFPLLK